MPVLRGQEQDFVFLITEALLHAVMPRLSPDLARTFVMPLHRYLANTECNAIMDFATRPHDVILGTFCSPSV